MAERQDRLADEQLARALRALGPEIAYPPTPDLAAGVRARLALGRPSAPRRGWPFARRFALALALLTVIVAATLAFSPEARETIAGRLGLPGITIVYVTPTVATTPPRATPGTPIATATTTATATVTPASAGERLALGQPLSLPEARGRVAFPVLVPDLPALGTPDEIYYGEPPIGGQIALVWQPRADLPPAAETGVGLLIMQFQGRLDPVYMKKLLGGETSISSVTVGDTAGYWITGEPHDFFYTNTSGTFPERTRLAGNVLLWSKNGITYRIEGARSLDEALRIAAAMR